MSEVLTRSLATTFCTLLPVLALLFFGGDTLKDFAFALMVGVASGAYSSIFIASPVLTHWKEREAGYRSRRARIVRELGAVPAYATTVGGAPVDVEPDQKRKRSRSGRLTSPEEPGEQISRDEFQELVADLDVEEKPGATRPNGGRSGRRRAPGGSAGAGVAQQAPPAEPKPPQPPQRDPAADLTPEDLVLKDDKAAPKRKRPRNKRHGRR
jgi:SecD/SecF fusion protein